MLCLLSLLLIGLLAYLLAYWWATAIVNTELRAPAVKVPALTTVAAAHELTALALATPPWVGEADEYQVYRANPDVEPYLLDTAAGIQIVMREDEHILGNHGAVAVEWLRNKPPVEVWYRNRQGDEAFCLLVADAQSTVAMGIFLGARGLGELSRFDWATLDHRLALTGWVMSLDRWHKRLPMQGYGKVW